MLKEIQRSSSSRSAYSSGTNSSKLKKKPVSMKSRLSEKPPRINRHSTSRSARERNHLIRIDISVHSLVSHEISLAMAVELTVGEDRLAVRRPNRKSSGDQNILED